MMSVPVLHKPISLAPWPGLGQSLAPIPRRYALVICRSRVDCRNVATQVMVVNFYTRTKSYIFDLCTPNHHALAYWTVFFPRQWLRLRHQTIANCSDKAILAVR